MSQRVTEIDAFVKQLLENPLLTAVIQELGGALVRNSCWRRVGTALTMCGIGNGRHRRYFYAPLIGSVVTQILRDEAPRDVQRAFCVQLSDKEFGLLLDIVSPVDRTALCALVRRLTDDNRNDNNVEQSLLLERAASVCDAGAMNAATDLYSARQTPHYIVLNDLYHWLAAFSLPYDLVPEDVADVGGDDGQPRVEEVGPEQEAEGPERERMPEADRDDQPDEREQDDAEFHEAVEDNRRAFMERLPTTLRALSGLPMDDKTIAEGFLDIMKLLEDTTTHVAYKHANNDWSKMLKVRKATIDRVRNNAAAPGYLVFCIHACRVGAAAIDLCSWGTQTVNVAPRGVRPAARTANVVRYALSDPRLVGQLTDNRAVVRHASHAFLMEHILTAAYLDALAARRGWPPLLASLTALVRRSTPENLTRRVYRWYARHAAPHGAASSNCRNTETHPLEGGRGPRDRVVVRPTARLDPVGEDEESALFQDITGFVTTNLQMIPEREQGRNWLHSLCEGDEAATQELYYSRWANMRSEKWFPLEMDEVRLVTIKRIERIARHHKWRLPDPARTNVEMLFWDVNLLLMHGFETVFTDSQPPQGDAARAQGAAERIGNWIVHVLRRWLAREDNPNPDAAGGEELPEDYNANADATVVIERIRVILGMVSPGEHALPEAFRDVLLYLVAESLHVFVCGLQILKRPHEEAEQPTWEPARYRPVYSMRTRLFDGALAVLSAHRDAPSVRHALQTLRAAAAIGQLAWSDLMAAAAPAHVVAMGLAQPYVNTGFPVSRRCNPRWNQTIGFFQSLTVRIQIDSERYARPAVHHNSLRQLWSIFDLNTRFVANFLEVPDRARAFVMDAAEGGAGAGLEAAVAAIPADFVEGVTLENLVARSPTDAEVARRVALWLGGQNYHERVYVAEEIAAKRPRFGRIDVDA